MRPLEGHDEADLEAVQAAVKGLILTVEGYLIDKKQVDGVSRAVERAWHVKRGGGSTFKNAKALVETLMAQRPAVQTTTAA